MRQQKFFYAKLDVKTLINFGKALCNDESCHLKASLNINAENSATT